MALAQMTFGVFLKTLNALHYESKLDLYFECIPQVAVGPSQPVPPFEPSRACADVNADTDTGFPATPRLPPPHTLRVVAPARRFSCWGWSVTWTS